MTEKILATLEDFAAFIEAGENVDISVNPVTGVITIAASGELEGTLDWGNITGTLADQTDLQAALDAPVELTDLADVTGPTVIGRVSGEGNPQSLSSSQLRDIINVFAAGHRGLVPDPESTSNRFLRDDATWVVPPLNAPVDSVFGRTGTVEQQSGDYDADQIDYDNNTSGLAATDVQAAIDEVADAVDPDHTHVVEDITDAGDLAALDDVTAPTHFTASGTPSDTTFLRGDNTWAEPPGAAGGEVNTGANVGSGGVGVFHGKSGQQLQFRHIASADAAISAALNSANIELTLNRGQIDHDDLGSISASQHRTLLINVIGNRPSAGTANRFFWATDEDTLYFDNGSTWDQIVAADHAHTLAAITDSGDLAALDTVNTEEIEDSAVTLPKLADGTASAVVGFASNGEPVEIQRASQGQAEAATSNEVWMTPLRTIQLVNASSIAPPTFDDDAADYSVTPFEVGSANNESRRFTGDFDNVIEFPSGLAAASYGTLINGSGTDMRLQSPAGVTINGVDNADIGLRGTVSWWRQAANEILIEGETDEDLELEGAVVSGNRAKTGTVSGVLTVEAHSGGVFRTTGGVTIPDTPGFNITLIAGGAHAVTVDGDTSPAMATGDMMSIAVDDQGTVHAVLTEATDKVVFS